MAGIDGHFLLFLVVAGRPTARLLPRGQGHVVNGVGFDVVDGHVAGRIPRQQDGRRSQGHRSEVGRRFWPGAFRYVDEESGGDRDHTGPIAGLALVNAGIASHRVG